MKLNLLLTVPAYDYLSEENAIKLSANSAFSFSGIESKMKTRNWRKVFKTYHVTIYLKTF